MTFATNMIATARRLLEAYGSSLTFDRVVEGSFVPSTGAVGAGTTTQYTAYGAPIPVNKSDIDGINVLVKDNWLWVESNTAGYVPTVGDVVTVQSSAYRVMSVLNYVAQGSTCVYKLLIRI